MTFDFPIWPGPSTWVDIAVPLVVMALLIGGSMLWVKRRERARRP